MILTISKSLPVGLSPCVSQACWGQIQKVVDLAKGVLRWRSLRLAKALTLAESDAAAWTGEALLRFTVMIDFAVRLAWLQYFCTPRKQFSNLAKLSKAVLGYPRVSKIMRSLVAEYGWHVYFALESSLIYFVSPIDPALLLLHDPSLSCLVVTQDVQIRESELFPCPGTQTSQCVLRRYRYKRHQETYIYDNVCYLTIVLSKENSNIPLEHTPNPQPLFMKKICSWLFMLVFWGTVLGVCSKSMSEFSLNMCACFCSSLLFIANQSTK